MQPTTPTSFTTSFLKSYLFLFIAFALLLSPAVLKAQDEQPEYEDITVFLMVQNVGGYEIDAIYMNDNIYVDVAMLFQLLKINHQVSAANDSISGFFLSEENRYYISANLLTAKVGNQEYKLDKSDVFRTDLGLYLKNTVYGRLFGLNLDFNFRNLSLELKTKVELPIIKELRQEQMRKNIDRLGGVIEVDTTFKRNYHLFRGGMADWSVISTQTTNQTTDTRTTLAGGAEIFGGEATGLLNYSTVTGFDDRQQQYRWRWANNDAKLIRQVQLGKVPLRSTSSIYAPVIGASISNTPTTFRKSFGTYTLSDFTEPGWTVELYINNVIVDFTTADASGFFSFEVPLVYGASQVTLKFYGPWGEERVREQTLNIPYNFLPKGTVEYNITGGVVRDSLNSTFTRAESQVGINKSLTVGGGIEYLSALDENPAMPFVNASARFLKNFMFTGEYTHGVRTRGLLNYRLPSNLVLEIDYTKYVEGQKAISFNYLEERKASLSVPIKIGAFRSFARMTYRENVLPLTTFSSAEAMLSSYVGGVSTNIAAFANWITDGKPYIYSNVALGFKLGRTINFRPQAQIDITNKEFISYKAEIEKSFSQVAHLSLVFEDNVRSKTKNLELSFRYDLPFAQTAASARISGKNVTTTESARGSFAFGSGNGYVHIDNRSATGRGAITIIPFLDINNNNIQDKNEPIAQGLSVRLNGGRIIKQNKDSLIRIIELEPYASYLLELDDVGFENIAWQLPIRTMSIQIDPNQFKKVGVPVKIKGEVNGTVYLKKGRTLSGQGRIIINIYNTSGKLVTRMLTESDGYFNYLGLMPGNYIAAPDSAQMMRLGYIAEPASFDFTITPSEYGDIIDDVTFTLTPVVPAEEPGPSGQINQQEDNRGKPPAEKNKETGQLNDNTDLKKPPQIQRQQKRSTDVVTQKPGTEVKDNQTGKVVNQDNISQAGKTTNQTTTNQKEKPTIQATTPTQENTLSSPTDQIKAEWFVQAGAYLKLHHAESMMNSIQESGYEASIIRIPPYHKVRIAGIKTRSAALKISSDLNLKGIANFIGR